MRTLFIFVGIAAFGLVGVLGQAYYAHRQLSSDETAATGGPPDPVLSFGTPPLESSEIDSSFRVKVIGDIKKRGISADVRVQRDQRTTKTQEFFGGMVGDERFYVARHVSVSLRNENGGKLRLELYKDEQLVAEQESWTRGDFLSVSD